MNAVDGSEHYGKATEETTSSLLTIILDTNPSAWSLLADDLSLSDAVNDLLIFINAHLAFNYANKVAVIASHCSSAQWLYPTPSPQAHPETSRGAKRKAAESARDLVVNGKDTKRTKADESSAVPTKLKLKLKNTPIANHEATSNKYRPFRLVEEEVVSNLSKLLASTKPSDIENTTSTMVAGALTKALCYINRQIMAYNDSEGGGTNLVNASDPTTNANTTYKSTSTSSTIQSRILLLSVSPSTDLAHQYIPIMNTIFACQRLSIPIDICQIPLPTSSAPTSGDSSLTSTSSSTVFLQQASDATHGIFIPLPSLQNHHHKDRSKQPSQRSWSLLQYLFLAFLPSNKTRASLILPTRIDVDFRAACFCHRRVVDIGYVCSICLSIFCSVPDQGICLTCGSHLALGEYGSKPIVVTGKSTKKQKKKRRLLDGGGTRSAVGTPREGTATPTPGP